MSDLYMIREAAYLLACDLMEEIGEPEWQVRYSDALTSRELRDLEALDQWLFSLTDSEVTRLILGTPEEQAEIEQNYDVPRCSLTGESMTTVFADMI